MLLSPVCTRERRLVWTTPESTQLSWIEPASRDQPKVD